MKSKGGQWRETGINRGGISYVCKIGAFTLNVTNQHIDYPSQWLGSCEPFFTNRRLKSLKGVNRFAADAQECVMQMVIEEMEKALTMLRNVNVNL